MRKYCIFLLLFLFTRIADAQEYSTVLKKSEAYFTNDQGRIRAIKLDSVVTYGQDSLLYNYPNIRNVENSQCYSLQGGSWIGRFILQKPNGDEIYFNKNGDSILIKTQAAKGVTWISYSNDSTGTVATAVVKDIIYESFLGLSDSVKLIELNVQSTSGNSTYTLKISKRYGWVQTLSFYGFPEQDVSFDANDYRPEEVAKYFIAGLTNPEVGFQNFLWYKINDFNVGDELHTITSWCRKHTGSIIETVEKVLEKELYSDSIVYTWHTQELIYSRAYPGCFVRDTTYEEDTIRTTERIYKAKIFPDAIEQGYVSYKSIDSTGDTTKVPIYDFAQDYRLVKSKHIPGQIVYSIVTGKLEKDSTDSCFFFKSPYLDAEEFAMGLGCIYSNYSYGPNSQSFYLVYYKKGNEEWGKPLSLSIKDTEFPLNLKVYPNPFRNSLTIDLPESSTGIVSLISSAGVTLIKQEVKNAGKVELNLSEQYPGVYFLKFELNNKVWVEKVVKLNR